ncbi:MAG: PIN domain-containing protein [Eubacterium sp.]|nr:PIN domain-containing protein [Eubacterium sp.]
MVVLIDTNVIIDYLTERNGFFESSRNVMEICSSEDVQGYVAFHSIPNIWFISRKKSDNERRKMLKNICTILTVTGASHKDVISAIDTDDFKDFEDCLQDKCAVSVQADYIVTRNADDFKNSVTKVITPQDFCKLFTNHT